MTAQIVKPGDARALTSQLAEDAQTGEEILRLDREGTQAGAESLRKFIQAGYLLNCKFNDPTRTMRWADWLAQYCPGLSEKRASNYRRLSNHEEEIEQWIARQLAGGESVSQRGAIAYLTERQARKSSGELDLEGVPTLEELVALFSQIGRVAKRTGRHTRYVVEPHRWLTLPTFPRAYRGRKEMWKDWQANHEAWLETANQARRQAETLSAARDRSQLKPSTVVPFALPARVLERGTEEPDQTYRGSDLVRVVSNSAAEDAADWWLDASGSPILLKSQVTLAEHPYVEGTVTGFRPAERLAIVRWAEGAGVDGRQRPKDLLICQPGSQHTTSAPAEPDNELRSVQTLKSSEANGQEGASDRYSPEYLWRPGLDMWELEMFDLDPMTDGKALVPARVKYTKEIDGLAKPWSVISNGVTHMWSNPAFHLNAEFVQKLELELASGCLEAIVLNKHDHRTKWCNKLLMLSRAYCLVNHPVTFEGVNEKGEPLQSSFFPVTIFYFGPEPQKFAAAYSALGHIGQIFIPF